MGTKVIVIGFTGPSGSGKSTLAQWLANEGLATIAPNVGITYIEGSASLTHTEEQRQYLADTYGYEPKGHQNVINLSSTNPEFGYDFQRLLLEGRKTRLENLIGEKMELDTPQVIITDRTFIDIMVYATIQCGHNLTQEKHRELMRKALDNQSIFDLTFVPAPHENWTEDNGSRVTNNLYQRAGVMPVVDYFAGGISRDYEDSRLKEDMKINPISRLWVWDLQQRKETVLYLLKQKLKEKHVISKREIRDIWLG